MSTINVPVLISPAHPQWRELVNNVQRARPEPAVKVKTISVKYERRISLGRYESADFEIFISADVQGSDPEQAANDMFDFARETVRTKAMETLTAAGRVRGGKAARRIGKGQEPEYTPVEAA